MLCLRCVGKLVCMVGEHPVEHENLFPVSNVIRKPLDWLLLGVYAVRACGFDEDAGGEGEIVLPLHETRVRRHPPTPQPDCQT